MAKEGRNPNTPAEWQEAVDLAEFHLLVDSAKQYGLVEGGPRVNTRRCDYILREGKKRGVYPASHETLINRYLAA
jgi:hypothetical protein